MIVRVVGMTEDHVSNKSYDTAWKIQMRGMSYRPPHAIAPDRH